MNHGYPVWTQETECQDCYKCVRRCPVKAIRVKDGHATVIPELCVACGTCVEVCPAKAKSVRNDLGRARHLLETGDTPVYVSLAPSYVSEFRDCKPEQLIAALRALGFAGVSETALGAEVVSADVAREFGGLPKGLRISSACPTAVDYIRKYVPEMTGCISKVLSPVLAHAKLLQDTYGAAIKVVFIGPCIAKKNEADRHPELLALALTYPELRQWWREAGIDPAKMVPAKEDIFVPRLAHDGVLYPVDGGMNETIQRQCKNKDVNYATVSGLANLGMALDGLFPENVNIPVFLETLSCPGGCVHGPCAKHNGAGLMERLKVLNSLRPLTGEAVTPAPAIAAEFKPEPVTAEPPNALELRDALKRVGKVKPEDELNCNGCGYDTCRKFAAALLSGRAEPSMCVSYLKTQAQKKANAILRCIPSSVVIVDRNLEIIECNRRFAANFGEDTLDAFDACPGLAGADLRRIVPFADLFDGVLKSGKDLHRDALKDGRRLLQISIFNIEPHEVVGAVISDVTQTELHREQIAERAREVITKNLDTVQEIACRLGEHMADTELLLRSIADDYAHTQDLTGEKKSGTGEVRPE